MPSPDPIFDISFQVYSADARGLEQILRTIRTDHMSGSLTIHFSQGSPFGTVEWREKPPSSDRKSSPPVGPIRKLVK